MGGGAVVVMVIVAGILSNGWEMQRRGGDRRRSTALSWIGRRFAIVNKRVLPRWRTLDGGVTWIRFGWWRL